MIIQGTVTISIADYESLRDSAKKSDHYFKMACHHIELLDRIVEAVIIEDIDSQLVADINKALERWYG